MQLNRPSLHITTGACVGLSLALVLLPVHWIAAWFLTTVFHEAGHILAARCCRGRIYAVCFTARGAMIQMEGLPPGKQIFCALAGPLSSLLLLLVHRWTPTVAVFGMIQGIYNLLPLTGLDGGRILDGILRLRLTDKQVESVCSRTDRIVRLLLCALFIWAGWVLSWFSLAVVGCVAVIRRIPIKFPCKRTLKQVQYR